MRARLFIRWLLKISSPSLFGRVPTFREVLAGRMRPWSKEFLIDFGPLIEKEDR